MHLLRVPALLLGAWTLALSGATPAAASCATSTPQPSPHSFVGTVVATSDDGRVADVVTDEGDRVTVQGTEETSWFSDTSSTVDRRYALGGRYEFHPYDDDPPFKDDACTATRQLSGPSPSESPKAAAREGVLPAWLPVDDQSGPVGYALLLGPLAIAALGLSVLLRRVRRSRSASGVAGHAG